MAGLPAEGYVDVGTAGAGRHWVGLHSFAGMRGFRRYVCAAILCTTLGWGGLQGQSDYALVWHPVGEDTLRTWRGSPLPVTFRDRQACEAWLETFIPSIRAEGRLEASLDSMLPGVHSISVWFHAGPVYTWHAFELSPTAGAWLDAAGWDYRPRPGDPVDLASLRRSSERWLSWMDDNGYPFASLGLDSVRVGPGRLAGRVRVEEGPLYHVDSIVVTGPVAIRRVFLERYLGMPGGGVYRRDRLDAVSGRLAELGFLRETSPWSLTMVGTGATLNLFLESRKTSQVNVLAGLMPDNVQTGGRLLLTGEAQADLRNAFGSGESLSASWQQIQYRSPRLRIAYLQPYVFGSGMGLDLQLDFLRKDSSYLNLQAGVGLQFLHTARQTGRIGYQQFSTRLLEVDTFRIRATRALPEFNDAVNHLAALEYRYAGTDDRLRPRRGLDLSVSVAAGVRRVRENPSVTALTKDAAGRPFDFRALYDTLSLRRPVGRLRATLAHHIPLGRQSVLRLVAQGGALLGRSVFRNELYQIGGLRLLRGFDEESIFASSYAVGTVEYRLLTGGRSYFYGFVDAAQVVTRAWQTDRRSRCLGLGLGLAWETKAGMLNLAYALGKRDGSPMDPRQSKIHIGLTGLF
jgi:outer membrane protein assembly factor BamA